MKPRNVQEMVRTKDNIERGKIEPAAVWEVVPDGRGAFRRRTIAPKAFKHQQKRAWDKNLAAARKKLGLSQSGFARMLGISLRTLHHWEQGSRTPSGAARVLLRVAMLHPEVILEVAS